MKKVFYALLCVLLLSLSIDTKAAITVTSPNSGGSYLGCTVQEITWTVSFSVSRINIYYSLDGGKIWKPVARSVNYYPQTYSWNLPQVNSTKCLIKIEDYFTPTDFDISDVPFSITSTTSSSLQLLSPIGGEKWGTTSEQLIKWNKVGSISKVRIRYSPDRGANWVNIDTAAENTGTYRWLLPYNNISSNCLVRISDYTNNCIFSECDSAFTIQEQANYSITRPNGGETFYTNSTAKIFWERSFSSPAFVSLHYSTDAGATWKKITTAESNYGVFDWIIPNTVSDKCLVKVSGYPDGTPIDISNAVFSIANPSITISQPASGETLSGCSKKSIKWISQGTSPYVNIYFSSDNGNTWNQAGNSVLNFIGNNTFEWTTPEVSSNKYLVKISDVYTPTITATSNNFTITKNSSSNIKLTSPNGGDSLKTGQRINLTWTSSGLSDKVNIYYSGDEGKSWTSATTVPNTGKYLWTVPSTATSKGLVKVTDAQNECIVDMSDNYFNVVPAPFFKIDFPNTSKDTVFPSNFKYIQWTNGNISSSYVSISYSIDGGSTWTSISSFEFNYGMYNWSPPNIYSTKCLIKISTPGSGDGYTEDISDEFFTIGKPSLTITSPAGGESFSGCTASNITWTSKGSSSYVNLFYSPDMGTSWNQIGTSSFSNKEGNNTAQWTAPGLAIENCLIKIKDAANPTNEDICDKAFSIIKKDTAFIKITYPNNGEVIGTNSNANITWTTSGKIAGVNIKYSSDAGNTWTTLTSYNQNTGSYKWQIPNTPSTGYLISITDYSNTCTTDITDKPFSVVTVPSLSVYSYMDGQTYKSGNKVNINWAANNIDSALVKVEYSLDSARTWKLIDIIKGKSSYYSWNIPAESSTKAFIKVSMVSNPDIFDINDAAFTILKSNLKLTYPVGGETLTGCTNQTIKWNGPSSSGYVKIEYSIDGGISWVPGNTSASSSASENSFQWTVPGIQSNQFRIKLTDTNGFLKDSSANFSVNYTGNALTITSPTDNEVLNTGGAKKITWTTKGAVSNVTLQVYTTNAIYWTSLAQGIPNTGSYLWTLPTTAADNYRIAINDYSQPCVVDYSDKNFTIKENPFINVTWDESNRNVKWYSNKLDSKALVNIEFSSDSMKTWTTAATNEANDGAYGFTSPNVNLTNCFFRVSEAGNPTFSGINFTPLSISKHTTLTFPAGGEVVPGCVSRSIAWSSKGLNDFNILFSSDNGTTWKTIADGVKSYGGNNTRYWNPEGINSTQCLIRLVSKANPTISETSATPFSIQYTGGTLKVLTPNGGENFGTSGQSEVKWATTGSVPSVYVSYSYDAGLNWYNATSFSITNTGKFKWTIPNKASSDYLIKLSDNSGCVSDVSDAKFRVSETANISITSPRAGDSYYSRDNGYINWSSFGLSEFVTLDYSLDSGSTWTAISAKEPNNESYYWKIPDVGSAKVKVRVKDFSNPSKLAISDSVFTIIRQTITITSPNGGETLSGCTVNQIKWTNVGPYYYNLFYSLDAGATWNTIASSVYANSYNWTLPATSSSKCLIKVTSGSDPNLFDISDAQFTITNPTSPGLTLVTPNGGEIYKGGTDKTIFWTTAGTVSYVNIKYSSDGGTTWTAIANSTSNTGKYTWYLPTLTSSSYKVSVADASNACISDISEASFAIQSIPTLIVSAPKTGDTLYSYSTFRATISRSTDIPNYIVELSTDSLRTWKRISSAYFDPSENYKVPDIISHNCFIRASYGSAYGISSKFSIVKPVLTLTAPAGGESWLGCTYQTISWFSKGNTGYVNLLYSTDNGSTWKSIASDLSTVNGKNTYQWTIPATISKSCRIKVVSTVSNISSENTTPFTVNNGLKSFEVLSPIGGETWPTGSAKTILWESTGSISNVDLKYSIDGGTSWNNIAYNIKNSGSYNWTLPATTSNNALVRINDNSNSCVFDQSNFAFNINSALTLIYPNGGEKLSGCNNATITWSSLGISSYSNLYYSIDGGTSWNLIASAVPTTNGNNTYSWKVVGNASSNCLLKVVDYYNKAISDASNAKFTIESSGSSSITITSPNGGESWGTGKQKLITWTGVNVSDKVNISYSSDAGNTWYNLASGITNTGSYDWRLPGDVTSKYLVRVSDNANSCVTDQSDALFNVIPMPFITINSLNTYEKIYSKNYKSLYWSSGNLKTINLTLEYSVDSMKTWKNITGGYNFGGTFDWYVPNEKSDKCFIRIYDTGDPATFDINNAAFSISNPNITLTSPNGGENWAACSEQKIEWTSEQTSNKVTISHSTDNGVSWSTIASGVTNYTYNTYTWKVPSTASAQNKIRVQDYSNSSLSDISEQAFSISNNSATITLTSPNGGETLKGNSQKNITWTNTGTVSTVRISYSINNGTSWISITNSAPNNGSYNWTVPNNISSTQALIQVSDNAGCATDQSNAAFSIEAIPLITLTSPNGGQILGIGTTTYIVWNLINAPMQSVNIDYTTDNGLTWKSIATQQPSMMEYLWLIPNTPSSQCRIRVTSASDPSLTVMSSNTFTIAPAELRLLSHNGGEILSSCATSTISWTNTLFNAVVLYFSSDNGKSWSRVTTLDRLSGIISYPWTVPPINSDKCLFKISAESDTTMFDISNSAFTITNNYVPTIKITSPDGGESWANGSQKTITWTSDASVKSVNIKYSSDNGTTWTYIARLVNNSGSYNWTLPSKVPSSKTLVQISDVDNICNSDISNASFNITGTASVSLISPNGGEKIIAGSMTTINWDAAFLTGKIKLEYSLNSGTSWTLISDTIKNTESYNWQTPSTESLSGLIRISDAANASVSDVSNAAFTLEYSKIRVSRPNGGESWYGNTVKSIFWGSTNMGTSFVKIEYSIDSARTWKVIAEKEANDGAYSWTLPNSGSVNCYVKVSDYNNPAIYDMNDTVFTMIRPAFTILSPNGGETLKSCTFTTVTWAGNSTGNLYYSTDGGTSWTSFRGGLIGNYSSSWMVPDISSSKCLVKIVDPNDATQFDISDAPFTINNTRPTIKLTSPNGGETWGTGENHNITWIAPEEVKFVKLEVSINNSSYGDLFYSEQVANTGSKTWTVYNNPGTAKVRISDKGSCAIDESDAAFTIKATPFISVKTPDDVHQWTAGTYHEIEWNSGNLTNGKVNVHYSTDGGRSWILIESNYTGSTIYWKVPYTYTDNCVIRVADAGNPSIFATSQYIFKIVKPTFSYISFSNGKELSACMRTNIYWSSQSSAVNIYYSTDSGSTWKNIVKNVSSNQYEWTVPQENSTKCFVKIADAGDETAFGIGDVMFSINNPVRTLKLTTTFTDTQTGSLKTISWENTGNVYNALLEYSTDGGTSWKLIEDIFSYGPYKWRVPNDPSVNALFRISDKASCALAQSNPFKIEAVPYIYTIKPEGNENWDAGTTQYLYWSTGNLASQAVNLYYSADSTKTWTKFGSTSESYFAWTVPYISSSKVFIKVSSASNAAVYGMNESPFTISKPEITVKFPNGREKLTACVNNVIRWENKGVSSVYLYYSTDNGLTWTRIYSTPTYKDGYENWALPELSSTKVLIKVADSKDPLIYDVSDAVFEIQNINTTSALKLTTPNGGEVWDTYSEHEIKWTTTGTVKNVNLMYSTYGGLDWEFITSIANSGSYSWQVPNTPTLSGVLKIMDAESCVSDVSDNQFDIKTVPSIKIEAPKLGDDLTQSAEVYVGGRAANLSSDYVKLEYSTNNGTSWVFITENATRYYNTFYYYWKVPQITSTNVLLKASDPLDPKVYYISEIFKISPATNVWPGDVDNNGVADVYDMLPIGLNFGETGIPRTSISTEWQAFDALNWNKLQSNGLDMKFSDCDGNGSVYFQDTLAIIKNYGLTHPKSSNLRIAAEADLFLIFTQPPVPGEIIEAEIWAGKSSAPVNSLYGIAFNLEFNADAVEPNSASLSFKGNWLGTIGSQTMGVYKAFESIGRIDGSLVRFDKTSKTGYGKIADLKMRLKPNAQYLSIGFTSNKAINSNGTPIILSPKSESVVMITTSAQSTNTTLQAEVYPNPTSGDVYIKTALEGKVDITITNTLGEAVFRKTSEENNLHLSLQGLPGGAYFVKIDHESGTTIKKLILQ
ncbi:MAG: T9SS type A sorting domain-containing protein [Sporocytophaga sp.]|uniref:T9SS type A sorting domain-containing protein n=1 Tax=Sporocytophaga sp. TaxID=2231183 RepID=UPI001B0B7FEA|nr:Ser-Thr-rich GPI-anchored membrane family protein [Sporocytophaga sp.]MBO9699961.1 T9SS type A sorting domain-containing protein [Sporocytophaga sp.]